MFSRVLPQTPGPEYLSSTTTELPALDAPDIAAAASLNDFNLALDAEFWSNAIEEDSFYSPLPFDASERGLWNGRFVPPPPRPPFWDDSITSDGLTTCDLCTWASHERNAYSLDGSISGKFSFGVFFLPKKKKTNFKNLRFIKLFIFFFLVCRPHCGFRDSFLAPIVFFC